MARSVIVHIGSRKSGTTYIQRCLAGVSREARDHGVLYPVYMDPLKRRYNHEAATYGLLGREAFPWLSADDVTRQERPWRRLVRAIRGWDGTVLLSAEALSIVRRDDAERFLEALGCEDVRIVVTARDLGRVIPSSWQQSLRNGRATPLDGYLRQVREQRQADWESDPEQMFWRGYATGPLVARWAPLVTDVSVVTVPAASGGDTLWSRFLSATRLDNVLPSDAPQVPTSRANVGLTAPEALFMQHLNEHLASSGLDARQQRFARNQLISEVLVMRERRGDRLGLPAPWLSVVRRWSYADRAGLELSRIVGTIDDLEVTEAAVGMPPAQSDLSDVAQAAAACLASVWPEAT